MRAVLVLLASFALACSTGRGTSDPDRERIDEFDLDSGIAEELCGNAVVDDGEDCDPGADDDDRQCGCQDDCTFVVAGDACEDGDLCTVDDACDGLGDCVAVALECDDGDACTTDSCDGTVGECVYGDWEGDTEDLYDMEFLTDPETLDLEFLDTDTVWEGDTPVEVAQIAFTSYESDDCEIGPIRVEAYVAATGSGPGLVVGGAHGADNPDASGPAAEYGLVVLAFSSPGQGSSRGTPNTTAHLKDLDDDPRDSWFWEDSVLAIRALTVLTEWPGVDVNRLGVHGHSGSDVAAQLVAGVDERVSLAVVEPSFPDLGGKQARFEETLQLRALAPTLVLGSSVDVEGTAAAYALAAPDGRLLVDDDADAAFRFWIEGRWELDYGFYNVPDHPVRSGSDVETGDTTGYTVLGTSLESADGLDWATVEYESVFEDTFSLSSTPE